MGSDMSTLSDRVARHGTQLDNVAENIFAGCADPIEIIKLLVIDDGVASRGNRANIFSPDFHAVGIGAAPHPDHACICVIDYAGGMAPGGTPAGYGPAVGPAVFDIAACSEARLANARATAGALPAGCVSRSVEVCTRLADARRTVTTTPLYQFADGHKESCSAVEETGYCPAHSLAPGAGRRDGLQRFVASVDFCSDQSRPDAAVQLET